MWLMANSPSTICRSSGVGWIAVNFKDKGEKTMEVVNNLADEFSVKDK